MAKDKMWRVEALLDCRIKANGKREYKVKWANYPLSEASWEPAAHLTDDVRADGEARWPLQPSSSQKSSSQKSSASTIVGSNNSNSSSSPAPASHGSGSGKKRPSGDQVSSSSSSATSGSPVIKKKKNTTTITSVPNSTSSSPKSVSFSPVVKVSPAKSAANTKKK